ncbi:MAG: DUF11 domain-containing protein, partial [Thermoplasmata archaeon]|nr:DUF11 domain-containing protein [Thermoplasmata archaeon]
YLWFNFTNMLGMTDCSFTITVRINDDTSDCLTLVNNVTCEYGLLSGVWFEITFDDASTHVNRPTITVNKTVDISIASEGMYLNYTITFTNEDSGTAPFVWINDTLPFGVTYISDTANLLVPYYFSSGVSGRYLFFNFTDIPGFSSFSFQITVQIDLGVYDPGDELWNWVTLEYVANNSRYMNISIDSAVTIISDMVIVKVVDLANAAPGDFLTYTIFFNNTGSTTAAYVWINDTLPAGVTYVGNTAGTIPGVHTLASWGVSGLNLWFNFTDVLPGPHSFTITVQIQATTPPGTVLENWAFMNYTNAIGMIMIESADNATTIVDSAIIVIEKTVNQTVAMPGDFLQYTIWFNNTGQADATTVWINDTLPIGVSYLGDNANLIPSWVSTGVSGQNLWFNFSNVPPGVYSFTIDVQIDTTVPNGTVLTNWVTCDYETGGYQYEQTQAEASTLVIRPYITVEKTVDPQEATIGETLTYTIWFNNTGWGNATVNITDVLPPGVLFISAVDVGTHILVSDGPSGQLYWANFTDVAPGVHYVVLTVEIEPWVIECNWLINTVFLNYSIYNGVAFLMSWYTAQTHVVVPNVTIEKSVDRSVASPGYYLTYTITFTNWNQGTAGTVNITDNLPQGVVYISDDADTLIPIYVSSGVSGQNLWFNFSDVPTGSYSFDITVYINPNVAINTTLVNWAFLNFTTQTGIVMPIDIDNATTLITWMAVVKVVSQPFVQIGDNITYTIFFNNTANFTMAFVWINDTLPAGVTYISDNAATPGGTAATFAGAWNDSVTWYYNFTNVTPGAHWFTIT